VSLPPFFFSPSYLKIINNNKEKNSLLALANNALNGHQHVVGPVGRTFNPATPTAASPGWK